MPPPNTPEEGVAVAPQSLSNTEKLQLSERDFLPIDYQILEYVGPVDETLMCPVCRTPFYKPVSTPCGHSFCGVCISTALDIQPTCPIDRKPIGLDKTRDFSPLPLIIKDQLDRLSVKCPNDGCDHVCSRDLLEGHYSRYCELTPIRCPDPECDRFIARRLALGDKECQHRYTPCQYCEEMVMVVDLDAHYEQGCSGSLTECPECHANIVRHHMRVHKQEDCPETQIRCKWDYAGCKVFDKRRVVLEHEEIECTFEPLARLIKEREEDKKTIADLGARLAALEARNRRRERHAAAGATAHVLPSAGFTSGDTVDADQLAPYNMPAYEGSWGSPEDYMLAQFERMEAAMEELRKSVTDVDGRLSMALMQQTVRTNDQLADLASKVGVINMHTAWLMNLQRQIHGQQRATPTGAHPPPNNNGGGGGDSRGENGFRYPAGVQPRRNSDARGQNPPRL